MSGIEFSKEYTVESIENPVKWDRAISVTSNQGFDNVVIESEDLHSDPPQFRKPLVQTQEPNKKSQAKKTSKAIGVSLLKSISHNLNNLVDNQ